MNTTLPIKERISSELNLQDMQIQLLVEASRQLTDTIAQSKTSTKRSFYQKKLKRVLTELVRHDRKSQVYKKMLSEMSSDE